jgi:hypothetical protein
MIKWILKGIEFLQGIGILGKVVEIEYQGQGASLNDFYSQGHWSKRSQIKKKYRAIFDVLLSESRAEWMAQFYLVIFYNSRHDVDNVIGMEKVFVDALKRDVDKEGNVLREGYVADDDKRYFRGVAVFPNENLPKNTFQFLLIDADGKR